MIDFFRLINRIMNKNTKDDSNREINDSNNRPHSGKCKFEFLIKRKEYDIDGADFDLDIKDYLKIFSPENNDWMSLDNGEGYDYSVDKFTYGFQEEYAGFQFGFYGEVDHQKAKEIIFSIKNKLEIHSGFPAEVIDYE